jgi:hypothetical protein
MTGLSAGTYYVKVDEFDNNDEIPSYTLSATITQLTRPDLVVQSPGVDITTPLPGQTITVSATVGNVGTGTSPATTLRYYLSADSIITVSDTELATDPVASLASGATSLASAPVTAPANDGTYWAGACVDMVIDELNVFNNCSIAIEITVSSLPVADAFEPDDTSAEASTITSGSPQEHSIVPATDTDWVTFTLASQSRVTVETSGMTGDTRMWLYDSNLTELVFNDNQDSSLFAAITMDQLSPGTYFVRVDENGNNNEVGSYTLSLTIDSKNRIPLLYMILNSAE